MTTKSKNPNAAGMPDMEDTAEFAKNMAIVMQRSQQVWAKMMEANAKDDRPAHADPMNIMPVFSQLGMEMISNPEKMAERSLELWSQQAELWRRAMMSWTGAEAEAPVAEPVRGDKRFKDDDWSSNQVFDYLKQTYLVTSRWTQDVVHNIGDMPERDRARVDFYTRAFVEAMSPSNFAATNPEVLRTTMEQKGANLMRGVEALARDVDRGKGKLIISQTDMDAFEVGRDMAVTEGAVIWQSNIMQLIQYSPTTEEVHARPLMFIPPWINKYYILDLNEKKSMVKWLVDQGYTVFMISWVNPTEAQKDETWQSYMDAVLDAIDVVRKETSQERINVAAYCVGGSLTGAMLAYLAREKDNRIASATMFTAQVEFSSAGELQVFVDDKTITVVDEQMDKGYLPAESMANAFNMLRSADLIWGYIVQNYMLGKDPFPFDLLYWNADSTSMPARVHHQYLEQCYTHNELALGLMEVRGAPVDLGDIKVPMYHLASKEDHIAPSASVYRGAKLMKNAKNRFVIAGSGHIAGVVNPPSLGKYQHWTSDGMNEATLDEWLAKAEETPGSWWPDWDKWLSKQSLKKIKGRTPGAVHGVLEAAPGSYVKERFDKR
jgi:polyhydroxyalkanoate synthase